MLLLNLFIRDTSGYKGKPCPLEEESQIKSTLRAKRNETHRL